MSWAWWNDSAREVRPEDESQEFPTLLNYLLYEVVDATVLRVNDAEV
jgi:hypothetical protein